MQDRRILIMAAILPLLPLGISLKTSATYAHDSYDTAAKSQAMAVESSDAFDENTGDEDDIDDSSGDIIQMEDADDESGMEGSGSSASTGSTTRTGGTVVSSSGAEMEQLVQEEYAKMDELRYQLDADILSARLDAQSKILKITRDGTISSLERESKIQSILSDYDSEVNRLERAAENDMSALRDEYKYKRSRVFSMEWHRVHPLRVAPRQ